jgi:hypothetical protein
MGLATVLISAACTSNGAAVEPTTTASSVTAAQSEGIPPPPPPAPMANVLRLPTDDVFVGITARPSSYVFSEQPIVRLVLWSDGAAVDTFAPEQPGTEISNTWEWVPPEPGLHVLIASAIDAAGRVTYSSPRWVRAREVAGVAASAGNQLTLGGGGLGHSGLVAAPSPAGLWTIMSPPVTVNEGDCTATLPVPSDESADGIAVFAAGFGATSFAAFDLLPPSGGTLSMPLGPSPQVVYWQTYEGTNAILSPPVVVPGDPCAAGTWEGDFTLADGVLTTGVAADAVYLYLTKDGEHWQRVPAEDQTFVHDDGDGFDFAGLLPPFDGPVTVEAWGRSNGALVALGTGTYMPPTGGGGTVAGTEIVGPLLPGSSLRWVAGELYPCEIDCDVLLTTGKVCDYPPPETEAGLNLYPLGCTTVDPAKVFRWTLATASAPTHGLLQVSKFPPPSGPVLSFPGLLLSKKIDNVGGDFSFDLNEVLHPKLTEGTSDMVEIDFGFLAGLSESTGSGSANTVGLAPLEIGLFADSPLPNMLYLRVVPIQGTQPLDSVTNTVNFQISYSPGGQLSKPEIEAFTYTVTATPPALPNPDFHRCVRVVENPFGSGNPSAYGAPFQQFYNQFTPAAPGNTLCAGYYPPADDDWWDVISDAVDFVTDTWDSFADFVMNLKSSIVNAIVKFSGCQPADVCKVLVGTLANVGLAYLGIPPTMPSFSELAEAAKGDLKEIVIEAAAQSGVLDCGEAQALCEEMAEKMLDKLLDEIEKEVSTSAVAAASSGSYQIWLNPAIKVIPEPASIFQPAVFNITFTRSANTAAPLPPNNCTITGHLWGQRPYKWYDGFNNQWKDEQISGPVMNPVTQSFDLTLLAPGESKTVVISLPYLAEYYLPGQAPELTNNAYNPVNYIFFETGKLIANLTGCVQFGQSFPQDGVLNGPEDYPNP